MLDHPTHTARTALSNHRPSRASAHRFNQPTFQQQAKLGPNRSHYANQQHNAQTSAGHTLQQHKLGPQLDPQYNHGDHAGHKLSTMLGPNGSQNSAQLDEGRTKQVPISIKALIISHPEREWKRVRNKINKILTVASLLLQGSYEPPHKLLGCFILFLSIAVVKTTVFIILRHDIQRDSRERKVESRHAKQLARGKDRCYASNSNS